MKSQTLGIGGMAFGGVLAARSGAWLVNAIRHPEPRVWPVALMTLTFIIGAIVAIWGARLCHRLPISE
jgi:hypothetical protein